MFRGIRRWALPEVFVEEERDEGMGAAGGG